MTFKTVHCQFYIYVGAVTLLIALSFGVSAAALHILQSPTLSSDGQRTLLAERVESAREIRRRLATPLAAPEPLKPITQWPAHAASRTVDQRSNQTQRLNQAQRSKPKLPRKALDAFAMDRDFSSQAAYPVVDRHAIR
jgi:hypothetical protein